MFKFIWAIAFALIMFFAIRSSLIPYVASNESIVAILVIFTLVVINSWIIQLINRLYNKKSELGK